MAKSNKERAELKKAGYVYDSHLQKWIQHEERNEYYRKEEQAAMLSVWFTRIFVVGVLIWMFALGFSQ